MILRPIVILNDYKCHNAEIGISSPSIFYITGLFQILSFIKVSITENKTVITNMVSV
jgi:hypothetical protein